MKTMSILILSSLLPNLGQRLPQLISQFGGWLYLGLFGLIFVETGMVILPFMPGDSLLFLCGSLAALAQGGLNLWLLIALLSGAAIAGDAVNFEIGEHFGPWLTHRSRLKGLIKPDYLARSQRFFQTHGKAAIFMGRFVPIIRTFIPFTAGISEMRYRDFATFNVIGGLSWVLIVLGSGYFFGNIALVKAHFELIMLAIVAISLLPAGILAWRNRGGEVDAH